MSSRDLLEEHFSAVSRCTVGGMKGDKFICTLPSGKEIFVKVRSKSEKDWFLWGLRKEYIMCQVVSKRSPYIPSSQGMFENDEFLAVGFEKREQSVEYKQIYKNKRLARSLVEQLVQVIQMLSEINTENYLLESLKGKEHCQFDGFTDTEDYMFSDRLSGEVYVANTYYNEFKDSLEKATQFNRKRYNTNREQIVHGDLLNPDNVLFSSDGVEAVVDWEICGWFDYLYDIANIEAMYIDKPAMYNTKEFSDVREDLYETFKITDKEKEILDCYKIWTHYLELEALNSRRQSSDTKNDIDRQYSITEGDIQKQYELVKTIQKRIENL